MSKHTPGPWKIAHYTDIVGHEDEPVDIAHVYMRTVPGRTEANARLIASAPDLLEALQLAFRHLNGGSDSLAPIEHDRAFKLARSAIAKATGND